MLDEEAANLTGPGDCNLLALSESLGVPVSFRDHSFLVQTVDEDLFACAKNALDALYGLAQQQREITSGDVVYAVRKALRHEPVSFSSFASRIIGRTASGKTVRPKTQGQLEFAGAMEQKTIVFAIGPAGTGKTYLAVVHAVSLLKKGEIKRIVLTRPAVEAGENLGFLPGDLKEKVDPYLTPLYDALYDCLGREQTEKLMERGVIEVAPLAYMRGRTLNEACVILDEAQNTTPSQMKMFLTRLGFGSRMVITGDITQIDLDYRTVSGLIQASGLLKDISEIAICRLTAEDVVRHPLVQKIIEKYEALRKE
ncbi:MAG: PhoH family protein [Solobacterium sp.]|nr:PhoH family protein [Solobacterium sp.]